MPITDLDGLWVGPSRRPVCFHAVPYAGVGCGSGLFKRWAVSRVRARLGEGCMAAPGTEEAVVRCMGPRGIGAAYFSVRSVCCFAVKFDSEDWKISC